MNEELEKIYEESFYPSADKLYKICKQLKIKVTLKEVKDFVANKATAQIFKRKASRKGHIIAFAPKERIQMDIVVMDKYGRTNSGMKYILLFIDVFTRMGYGIPMKTKNITDTSRALKTFCEKYFIPKIVNCDNSSFLGRTFNQVIEDKNIVLVENDVGDHKALGIVDRFIQTIKNNIYKYFKTKNTTNWTDQLQKIIDSYNNTPHPSIGDIPPIDAEANQKSIFAINIDKMRVNATPPAEFNEGDYVRIAIKKNKLNNRSYTQNFSDDVYEIERVTNKYLYLKDYDKRVPKSDVQKVTNPVNISSPELDNTNEENRRRRAVQRLGIEDYNNAPQEIPTYWSDPFS